VRFLWRLLINAAALWVAALLVPGVTFADRVGFFDVLLVALIFGLVNAFIRPVVKLLTLPINLITLGLFTIVVNALMVVITSALSSTFTLEGGTVEQFFGAVLAAIVISLVSMVLSWVLPDGS
jgi:putative membrane protein